MQKIGHSKIRFGENAVRINTFKFETKTFQMDTKGHENFEKKLFCTVRCACFCSLTYLKPHNEALGRPELSLVKDRGSEQNLTPKCRLYLTSGAEIWSRLRQDLVKG